MEEFKSRIGRFEQSRMASATSVVGLPESDFVALTDAVADPEALVVADLRGRNLLTALATRFDESVNELPLDPFDDMLALIVAVGEAYPGA